MTERAVVGSAVNELATRLGAVGDDNRGLTVQWLDAVTYSSSCRALSAISDSC